MRPLLSRIAELVLRRSREDRLNSEIAHHIDMVAEELRRGGMPAAEARLAARKQFGSVDAVRIAHRDQRGLPILDAMLQDVRFALRVLLRDRGFALTAVLVLGLGIGVNNMFFTVVYAHKFRGLPIAQPERVLSIIAFDDRSPNRPLAPAEFDELAREQRSFEGVAAFSNAVVTMGDHDRAPERFDAAYASSSAFPLLGIHPLRGRLFTGAEDRPGAAPVVVIGEGLWRTRYAAADTAIGNTILVNGLAATVAGVVPDRAGMPSGASVWLPLGQFPGLTANRSVRNLRVFGRLRSGVHEADARAEVTAMFARWRSQHPESNRNVDVRVVTINDGLLGTMAGWEAFIAAAIIVVLVACANVANLMIARASARTRELAIRTSLGASRGRLITQLLVEAGVLAAIGGVLGGLLSYGGVRLFESAIPEGMLPYWFDYSMDARVLAALAIMSLITVIIFGLLPAVKASRVDVNLTVKDGGRTGTGWLTATFLTAELALAMVMLTQIAIAGVQTQAANRLPTDDNINTTAVITAVITLPATYTTPAQRAQFFSQLEERLAATAGITAVSRATLLPSEGGFLMERRLEIEGKQLPSGATAPQVITVNIAPRYFSTLDLGLHAGRDFSNVDGTPGHDTAIVNERFVDVYLPGSDPIGARVALTPINAPAASAPRWLTVIGVARQIRQQGPRGGAQRVPVAYVPIGAEAPVTSTLMVRHTLEPQRVAGLLRDTARGVDANVPLHNIRTLQQAVIDAQWNLRVSNYLATTVCVLSGLLAFAGLYAVSSQRVTQRTREIGLRMALGARSMQVARAIMAGLRTPLVCGLVLGTLGTLAWDRAFSSGPDDAFTATPATLLLAALLIAVLVLGSCIAPLRRAIRINPVAALRHH
jgi:putative ABC transport system permease protein